MRFYYVPLFLMAALPVCAQTTSTNAPVSSGDAWKRQTFNSFDQLSQGSLGNAGANIYVRADGSITPIRSYSYKGDGYADLIFNNTHDHAFEIPVRIFRNKNGLPDPKDVIELPASAGAAVAAADLNGDGFKEIVVGNGYNNTKGHQNSFIYWGGEDGWKADRRTGLLTVRAQTVSIGDFKNNGKPAVFFGNHGGIPGEQKESFVYWGDGEGFAPGNKTVLRTDGALSSVAAKTRQGSEFTDLVVGDYEKVAVFQGAADGLKNDRKVVLGKHVARALAYGDLNGDGISDLLVADETPGKDGRTGIYFGGKDGLDPKSFLKIPVENATACAIGDFDKSGTPQIAIATYQDNRQKAATLRVFKLSKQKWKEAYTLPIQQTQALAAADVDGNGFDDLAVAEQWDGASKSVNSHLLLGGEGGLKADRSVAFPTDEAKGIALSDLFNTGKKDLIVANFSTGRSFGDIDTYVYYGGPDFKYSTERMSKIPIVGAMQSVSGDFNADGFSDALLISSGEDDSKNYLESTSAIFWGAKDGLSPERKTDLPKGARGFGATTADLNRDGYLDFVLGDLYGKKLRIYYGSKDGYTDKTLHAIDSSDPFFVRVVDLNGDGLLDIVSPHCNEDKIFIYWNSPEGYSEENISEIYHDGAGYPNFADLRNDGSLDMIITGGFSGVTKDFRTYSSIYWGNPDGYNNYERTMIHPGSASVNIAVSDLKKTGVLDLVVASYHGFTTRAVPSYIYWGDGKDFSDGRRTPLETFAASGNFIMDLNEDGWPDITFANHNKNNDHKLDAVIYWGSQNGYSIENVTYLPVVGPHMMADADPGNLMTRKMEEEYTSPVLEVAAPGEKAALDWDASLPRGTSLAFDVRAADTREALEKAVWTENVTKGESVAGLAGKKFLQFRCNFLSKTGAAQPRLISTTLLTQ